jgi:hypothetical protein
MADARRGGHGGKPRFLQLSASAKGHDRCILQLYPEEDLSFEWTLDRADAIVQRLESEMLSKQDVSWSFTMSICC